MLSFDPFDDEKEDRADGLNQNIPNEDWIVVLVVLVTGVVVVLVITMVIFLIIKFLKCYPFNKQP